MPDAPEAGDGKQADQTPAEPDLELPSLSFGLRRRRKARPGREREAEHHQHPVAVPAPPPGRPTPRPAAAPAADPTTASEHPDEPTAPIASDTPPTAAEEGSPAGPELTLPRVPPPAAAALTGVLCGLTGVLLVWLSAEGCDAARGVGSCGGYGLVALIAVVAIAILLGGVLLRAWQIPDPLSISFLGVSVVAVLAMLFFLDDVGSVWMVLVVPALSAATFWLSWWVTTSVAAGAEDR